MDKFVIRGGNPLVGTIRVSGAKNSALPCMAAAILTEDEVILENIPQVRDIETERGCWSSMGAEVELGYGRAQHRTRISCRTLSDPVAKYEIVKTMRASSLVLGPLIARAGMARVAMPGGCAIGGRPIDLHIKGLEKMGATITQEHGYLEARAERLQRRAPGLRQDHRHRHRRSADGRGPRRGRNPDGELRARAGGHRPGRAAHRHGREDRRRRHIHHSRPGRRAACMARAIASIPTASKPAHFWWPAPSPAAT